ncbi:cereblon family protein [Solidesulfovibrio sp.]|uniref:cereblon family protein n=1 Tax=Solidesulfovibrio sp. TaxID=2910990 RepID=UPI002636E895|nr:cereblon family protein [Solidesulfovibrio sp.]
MGEDLPGRGMRLAAACRGRLPAREAIYNHPAGNVNHGGPFPFAAGRLARKPAGGPPGPNGPHDAPQPRVRARAGEAPSPIRCAACLHAVTDATRRITVDGSHVHVFANPYGAVFEIGCFSAAPGCLASGLPSGEFTWFAGTTWQVALCAACGRHLGWSYARAEGGTFHGLIFDRLFFSPLPPVGSDQ